MITYINQGLFLFHKATVLDFFLKEHLTPYTFHSSL